MMAILNQPISKSSTVHPEGMPYCIYTTQPQFIPLNVPPGLEYLTSTDQVFIKQKVELPEVSCGHETKIAYEISSSRGPILFKANEDADCCTTMFSSTIRPYDMEIRDLLDKEIIHLEVLSPSICCWSQKMTVSSPPGTVIGTIEPVWSSFSTILIKNAVGDVVLKIKEPFCSSSCCKSDKKYKVVSVDGRVEVGKITRQLKNVVKETSAETDKFQISFPLDLDVRVKATLIGASFLIDFMYFERATEKNSL